MFNKVERLFLLGLRAVDPVRRARFFSLYHKWIAAGLFERLQFIICQQEWSAMSTNFWLKSALDMILAVLKEDDPIMLAPNSAQAPPLMPGTRTNVFNPSMQHHQQAAAQNEQQTAEQKAAAAGGQQQTVAGQTGQQQTPSAAADGPEPMQGVEQQQQEDGADKQQVHVKQEQQADEQHTTAADGGQAAAAERPAAQGAVTGAHQQPAASAAPATDAQAQQQQQHPTEPAAGSQQVQQQQPQQPSPVVEHEAASGASFPVTVRESDVPDSIKQLLQGHLDFLQSAGQLCVRDMMGPLREYAQVRSNVKTNSSTVLLWMHEALLGLGLSSSSNGMAHVQRTAYDMLSAWQSSASSGICDGGCCRSWGVNVP